MRIISMKCLAIILTLLISIPAVPVAIAQTPEARSINIFRVDGPNASLARGVGGREIEPREGQRLAEGNILTTGWDTQVYLLMDQASILKMDESTRLQIGSARSLLSITVQSGGALVDVTGLETGQAMETRIGNSSIGVRGTLYITSRRDTDVVTITMLSGLGEVTMRGIDNEMVDIPLPAGFMMWIYDVYEDVYLDDESEIVEQTYRISALSIYELGLFELEEIVYRQEYLIGAGILTPEMIAEAQRLIELLRGEREAEREALLADDEETVRVMLPGAETVAPEMDRSRDDDNLPNVDDQEDEEPDYTGYITIRGVRISKALTELNLNTFIGEATTLAMQHINSGAIGFGGFVIALANPSRFAVGFTDEEIAPLEYMTNLRELTIEYSYISDLSPLAGLINLRLLNLNENQIDNVAGLSDLVNLEVLELYDNQISSVASLAGLLNLTLLNLEANPEIPDLYTLAPIRPAISIWPVYVTVGAGQGQFSTLATGLGMPNIGLTNEEIVTIRYMTYLEYLNLDGNQFSEITLSNFPNLETLSLSNNQLNEINLSNLPSLEVLHLDVNQLSEVTLSNLPSLEVLSLMGNPLKEVTLYNLPSLRDLNMANNMLSEIELSNLPSLEWLDLWGNQLTSITLSGLPSLELLILGSNHLSQITLSDFPSLKWLDLSNNQLSEINLGNLPSLNHLSLVDNYLNEITLIDFPNLELLDLGLNQISDLNLSGLPSLHHLNLVDNYLYEITLIDFPNLELLDLSGNPL